MSTASEARAESKSKFLAGWTCLDFVNTVSGRDEPPRRERLERYADLAAWSVAAGLLSTRQARALKAVAAQRPRAAAQTLSRARTLREAIHDLCRAAAIGKAAKRGDLETLNRALAEGARHRRLAARKGGVVWRWETPGDQLDAMLGPIAASAAALLTGGQMGRVKRCPGRACGWLFFDRSKNRSRRWCEMEVCGNRAKARRHYRRVRTERG